MGDKFELLTLWLHRIGATLVLVVMLVVVNEVFLRTFFNRRLAGTAEIAANAVMILTFLQIPYVILTRKLIRVTFLYDQFAERWRKGLDVFAYSLGAITFGAMAVVGWEPAVRSLTNGDFFGSSAFRIPAWPVRLTALVLWGLATIACLKLAVNTVLGRMASSSFPDNEKRELDG